MFSLVLTVLILVVIYFLQEPYPFLAGVLAVAPIKVIATSFIAYEDGGTSRLLDAITGMLLAQVAFTGILFVVWFMLK
jgi:hypothetical protein